MADGDPSLRVGVGDRCDGRLQLGRPGERRLLGGVLLLQRRLQLFTHHQVRIAGFESRHSPVGSFNDAQLLLLLIPDEIFVAQKLTRYIISI